jgi:TPR repeat protein
MVRLGYMKQLGTGMPQDLRGAFALYKQSAETGTLEGQFMYALSYEQGSAPRRTR